jgi:hypothetical protein
LFILFFKIREVNNLSEADQGPFFAIPNDYPNNRNLFGILIKWSKYALILEPIAKLLKARGSRHSFWASEARPGIQYF